MGDTRVVSVRELSLMGGICFPNSSHPLPFLAQRGLRSLWPPWPFLINRLCCVGPRGQCPSPAPFYIRQSKQGCIYGVCVVSWALGSDPHIYGLIYAHNTKTRRVDLFVVVL